MYKLIVTGSLIGSLLIFCVSIDLFDNVLMFVLFGILPDRIHQLSAPIMLTLNAAAGVIFGSVLLRRSLAVQARKTFAYLRHTSAATVKPKPRRSAA